MDGLLVDTETFDDLELVDDPATFDQLRFVMAPTNTATTRPMTIAKPIWPATGQPRDRRQNFANLRIILCRGTLVVVGATVVVGAPVVVDATVAR